MNRNSDIWTGANLHKDCACWRFAGQNAVLPLGQAIQDSHHGQVARDIDQQLNHFPRMIDELVYFILFPVFVF